MSKVFTRGHISVQEDAKGVVAISLGEDLSNPETEVVGYLHKDYIDELIAVLRLFNDSTKGG